MAQSAARHAASAWKQHRLDCPPCNGRNGAPCPRGQQSLAARDDALAQLRHEREADRAVIAGQQSLFEITTQKRAENDFHLG